MKTIKFIFGFLNALSLFLIIVYISVSIPTFNEQFYKYEYKQNDVYDFINIEPSQLDLVTKHMLDYLRDNNSDLRINVVVDGNNIQFFSDRELQHMKDVKNLFMAGEIIKYISIFTFILTAFLIFVLDKSFISMAKIHKSFFIILIMTLLLFIMLVSINFETAFLVFHEIFFTNDLYLLDPNVDLLINIVPLRFFIDISFIIVLLILIFSFLQFLLSRFYINSLKSKD